jgi:HEAT repeat protein
MHHRKLMFAAILLVAGTVAQAQEPVADVSDVSEVDEVEALKRAAVEALISAPPERALPAATKVLQGNNSDELKESALFILSQIESAEAQALLLETARQSDGELREDAIQMIGIGGNPDALAGLRDIYATGDSEVREAVLEAYLIADDSQSIYELAVAADTEEDLENAVEMLGAMGAIDDLRALLDQIGPSEGLIEAYGIAGDVESLRTIATDSSNPETQAEAIEALGIVGDAEADQILVQIYKEFPDEEVREAALEGMLISGNDAAVLDLYRESTSTAEKKELLELLSIMGSEEVWDLIDEALENR